MKALPIDEMYKLRKWTTSSRRYWGQQRPGKNNEREDFIAHPVLQKRSRLWIYSNLLLLLIIVVVVGVAAIVGAYVK